jgi:hypothetical protein
VARKRHAVSGFGLARILAVVACLALLSAIAAYGLVGVLHKARDLSQERRLYTTLTDEQRSQYVFDAFDVPPAFRRFRASLREDDRFVVVVPAGESERASLYRAFSLYFLYPQIAARDVAHADAVLVLGPVPREIRRVFAEVTSTGEAWIGRRR